jgi:hypothetical protein
VTESETPVAAAPNLGIGTAIAAAAIAWLIPGGGHLYLKRWRRGVAFFALVAVSVFLGLKLEGHLYRPVPGEPLSLLGTIGQAGAGTVYGVLRFVTHYEGDLRGPGFEYGTAFLLTAGLMNLLLVFDAWDIALGKKA